LVGGSPVSRASRPRTRSDFRVGHRRPCGL
jgi:hypothetical protein